MATIGVKIELEGAPQYKENMSNLTAQTKLYQAQLKSLTAQMGSSASAFQKSMTESKALEQQLEAQKNQSKLLEEQIQKTTEKYGEDSTQVIKLKTQYQNLQAQIAETTQALEAHGGVFGAIGAQLDEIGSKVQSVGDKIAGVGDSLTQKLTAPIMGVAAASVKTAATFDSSMSQVAATMGYSVDELNDSTSEAAQTMEKLGEFAKDMGASTAFSASEAAEALNYMALAGYDAEKSMEMLPTVLDLAAAGGMDLAAASDMVTDSQSALGLSLEETKTMVDQMAKASSKSNTSVSQLGEAFLTVGGTAKNLKGGTTELSTALGILADNGVKGSEGGTALRNIILSLSAPTDTAAQKIEELGLEVFDAEGNMRDMGAIFQDLNTELAYMNQGEKIQTLNKIFNKVDLKSVNSLLANTEADLSKVGETLANSGVEWEKYNNIASAAGEDLNEKLQNWSQEMLWTNIDSVQGMASMQEYLREEYGLTEEDAKKAVEAVSASIEGQEARWDQLTGYINDAEGAASDMAEVQLNNLEGQITLLKSALEGAAISIGERLMPYITQLVEKIQGAVDWFNSLSDEQLELIMRIAGVVAVIGPALSVIGRVTSGVGSLVVTIGKFSNLLGTTLIPLITGTIIPAISAAIAVILPILPIILAVGAAIAALVLILKNWGTISEWLSEKIAMLQEFVTEHFGIIGEVIAAKLEIIKTVIFAAVEVIQTIVTAVMDSVKAIMQGDWQKVGEIILNAWLKIRQIIDQAKAKILQTIVNLLKSIVAKFGEMKDAALSWGRDMLQNFINGILEKWEKLKQTVARVAESIKDFLGFSEPSKGPLSNFHTYAPDMMKLFAQGIKDNQRLITDAIESSFNIEPLISASINQPMEINNNNTEVLSMLSEIYAILPALANSQIVLDSGALVGQTAPAMNAALGKIYSNEQRSV